MTDAAPDPALVRFDGVQKSYDGILRVVKDLHLGIAEGEFLTLLGPSGSGKTTTLMMLAGFETPTAGNILFARQRINDMPTYRRNFGMVFQNYALFPHMTVAENLAFPLRMHRFAKSEIPGRVERALDMIRLGAVADRRPAQLSGGQQQRVALARALVFEPRMVLMDEPLGALDKQLREHMQLEIRELHERLGLTMLYVTHDQTEAMTMSDRIAIFDDGRIQQVGPPDRVYDHPENAFVARFMGENNALPARVEARDGARLRLRCPAGSQLVALCCPEGLPDGGDAQVLVRPEQVTLGEATENCLRGIVADVIYQGDHLRVVVDVPAIGRLSARLPKAARPDCPSPGAEVAVHFAPEAALAFPAEDAVET